jgi:DNA-binding MarR family transcriptional regulator
MQQSHRSKQPKPGSKQLKPDKALIVPKDNLRRLVKNLSESVDLRLSEVLDGTPYKNVRPSDGQVMANVERGYDSIAAIAKQLNISRQAVHMSASRLQAHGLVDLADVPNNKRDKRIVITPVGYKQLRRVAKEMEESDAEFAEVIGAANFAKFRKYLVQLDAFLVARRRDLRPNTRK